MATRPCADSCFLLLWSRGKFSKNPDPTPWKGNFIPLVGSFFFASVEILLDILADTVTQKQQVPWGPSFQGNLTAAPAALLTPPAVVRTHIFKGAVAMDGEGRWQMRNPLEIPSRELTYPPQKGTFENDFPFPQVGYVSSLEGTLVHFI